MGKPIRLADFRYNTADFLLILSCFLDVQVKSTAVEVFSCKDANGQVRILSTVCHVAYECLQNLF